MKIIKTILYSIGAIYLTFLFLGGLISIIILSGSTNTISRKLIGVGICFLLTLLFGLLAILCCKKLYFLWHKIPNKPLDNIVPSFPEQTSSPSHSKTNLEIPNTYLQETITNIETPNKNQNQHILENTTEIPQNIQYVNTGNTIYRADGKSVTDEEVPYLIQVGYEEALKKAGLYNGQVLDQSFMQERDKNKKGIQEYLHTKNCQKYKPVILM